MVSDDVGSSYCFVKNDVNGLIFSHKKNNDFKSKMKQLMKLSKQDLEKMSEESYNLSKSVSTNS